MPFPIVSRQPAASRGRERSNTAKNFGSGLGRVVRQSQPLGSGRESLRPIRAYRADDAEAGGLRASVRDESEHLLRGTREAESDLSLSGSQARA
jgi:hypothetical protein